MSGIGTAIQLNDRMSPIINSITSAVNSMLNTFESTQRAVENGLDMNSMYAAREAIVSASDAVAEFNEQMKTLAMPELPPWNVLSGQKIFMNSGADRFADELQSADQMAQQLFQTQQRISEQARNLMVTPSGMLNDVEAVESRIENLANRIQMLDDIPLHLRTDQTNNELENLRTGLMRAADTQENLNQAMNQMDISAANVLYQQLDNLVGSMEQRIRNNLSMVQEVPEPPSWNALSGQEVFKNSGVERFELEFQAADYAARQLFQTQQEISAKARQMQVVPPGMLNDTAMVENKIQGLAVRVNQLNQIPVDLRTERVNHELENLRSQLGQAIVIQNELDEAMGRMDVATANAAYQKLNAIIDATDRDIRDNLNVQEQFNQSIQNGQTAATGLDRKIKSIAMSAAAAFSVQKVIALADSATQTTARLNLMNDGLQSTERLNQMIFASAQRARAPYMETAGAIAKMGLNAGDAFDSNRELIAFMEQVNKQFVIGGASAQEQANAMTQLSQAMAAGALRGEELNSILDAAPGIARTIERNMGWAEGSIKQYAEKGAVSAQVVKSSLLNMAEETNEKFASIPMTFSQVITTVQTTMLQTFWPLIQLIGSGASFINENWSTIAPVFYGLAVGIAVAAAAWGIYTAATWLSVTANQALVASMLTNPFLWIAIVVGVIVAAIYRWVQAVGGLRVAWLICVNAVLTAADNLQLGFLAVWMETQNGLDNMQYGFAAFKAGVLNHLGNMKVKGLTIIQDFINGAIERINKLISTVNSIAGTSIELVGHVEFAAGTAAEEEVKRQQRAADLTSLRSRNAADKAARQTAYDRQQRAADDARMQRQAAIAAAKNSAALKADENNLDVGSVNDIATNTGSTAGSTAAMADSMDLLEEDLKYMRDAAEQEIINRFTLAELKVDVNNNNTLKTKTDFDDVNRMLGNVTAEILAAAAEGGGHV